MTETADLGLTVVLGLRAHGANPWVLPRLQQWAAHYDPRPSVIVADMGSTEPFATRVASICESQGFERVRIEDEGIYSQSVARNAGALAASTDLVFFCDVDCIGPRDLFARLMEHAKAIDLYRCFDQLVVLPAYHLEREASEAIVAAGDDQRHETLARTLVDAVYAPRGTVAELIDPFSNLLLCHRAFFDLAGGYDPAFRGHGSEDFEFMIRCGLHGGHLPLPARLPEDLRGPTDPLFWGIRPYEGFRRLGEATAVRAELAGLRMAHLWHPRSRTRDAWYEANDWGRDRFDSVMARDLEGWTGLLQSDGLERVYVATALVREDWQASVLLPLRWRDIGLQVVQNDHRSPGAVEALDAGPLHFIVSQPGDEGGPLVARARSAGREVVPIERGSTDLEWRLDGPDSPPTRFVGSRERGFRVVQHPSQPNREFLRALLERPLSPTSYAAARLGLAIRSTGGASERIPPELRKWLPRSVREESRPKRAMRKLRKLLRDPRAFVTDSFLGYGDG